MHPAILVPIVVMTLFVMIPFALHLQEIHQMYRRNVLYPLYRLRILLFCLFALIPLSSIGFLIDYGINNQTIIAESKVEPVQVIKNAGFSQQFVLDKNGKVVIMDGYTEHENARVDTLYYTGSFPFIRSDDKTKVTPTKD